MLRSFSTRTGACRFEFRGRQQEKMDTDVRFPVRDLLEMGDFVHSSSKHPAVDYQLYAVTVSHTCAASRRVASRRVHSAKRRGGAQASPADRRHRAGRAALRVRVRVRVSCLSRTTTGRWSTATTRRSYDTDRHMATGTGSTTRRWSRSHRAPFEYVPCPALVQSDSLRSDPDPDPTQHTMIRSAFLVGCRLPAVLREYVARQSASLLAIIKLIFATARVFQISIVAVILCLPYIHCTGKPRNMGSLVPRYFLYYIGGRSMSKTIIPEYYGTHINAACL